MTEKSASLLREATVDDVMLALQNTYITPPLSKPADLLEFYNRMLDVLGVPKE